MLDHRLKTRLEEPIEKFDDYQICENYRLKTSQNNNNNKYETLYSHLKQGKELKLLILQKLSKLSNTYINLKI